MKRNTQLGVKDMFNGKKTRRIAAVIILIVIAAMVATMELPYMMM